MRDASTFAVRMKMLTQRKIRVHGTGTDTDASTGRGRFTQYLSHREPLCDRWCRLSRSRSVHGPIQSISYLPPAYVARNSPWFSIIFHNYRRAKSLLHLSVCSCNAARLVGRSPRRVVSIVKPPAENWNAGHDVYLSNEKGRLKILPFAIQPNYT